MDVLTGQVEGLSVPDLIIVVVDVENLQRNLFLASQAADLEIPLVIALNCWDQAEKKGLQIDYALLESRLMTALMSCSARLPVYILLIGAFSSPSMAQVLRV